LSKTNPHLPPKRPYLPDPPFDTSGYGDKEEEYRYEADKNIWHWREPEE
jgi:hypothetical protein